MSFFSRKGAIIASGVGIAGLGAFAYFRLYPYNREIYYCCTQTAEADAFTIKKIEEAFSKVQATESKSMLKKYLTQDVVDQLKGKKTKLGATLLDVIRSGVANPDSSIGVYAADKECYNVFAALFDPIILQYHGFGPKDRQPATDLGKSHIKELPPLDPEGKYIKSTRIRTARTLQGYPFNPLLNQDDYTIMQEKVKTALEQVADKEIAGKYYPLKGMTKEVQNQLIQDHFLFKEGDRFLQAANACNYWPTGRGIFHNNSKTFLVWVNEEDHLRIISMQEGGNVGEVLERLIKGIESIEKKVPFSRDDRLGWLTFCPTNLGTSIRASVHIKLPKLSAKPEFDKICTDLKLQKRGIHGEHSESAGGVYDISNIARLGLTEFEAVKQMYDGVKRLIELEKQA
ncbi:putative arginine kinase F46H5.3 [Ditylenchus destructor]|nr:putative arginine kinase F46H5.3 [Ditylenchus destructor]